MRAARDPIDHENETHGAPRLSAWSVRRPWRALGSWILLVAVAIAAGVATGTTIVKDSDSGTGDSGTADRIVGAANFDSSAAKEQALVRRRDDRPLSPVQLTTVRRELASALAATHVTRAPHAPITSRSGRAALIQWDVLGSSEHAIDKVPAIQAAVARVQRAHADLRVQSIGTPSIEKALNDKLGSDFQQAEVLSLPLTLLILIVVFGALVAASVPLLLAITAIAAAFGISSVTSHAIPQTETLKTILLLVGVAVGVDYALFLLRRSRDERRRGASVRESVLIAAATSGRAVLVSGLTEIGRASCRERV